MPRKTNACTGICPLRHLSFEAFVLRDICPSRHLSFLAFVRRGICPSRHLSFKAFVLRGICPSWHLSVEAFVLLAFVLRDICHPDICPSRHIGTHWDTVHTACWGIRKRMNLGGKADPSSAVSTTIARVMATGKALEINFLTTIKLWCEKILKYPQLSLSSWSAKF